MGDSYCLQLYGPAASQRDKDKNTERQSFQRICWLRWRYQDDPTHQTLKGMEH